MYFSQFKSNKRSYRRKRSRFKNDLGVIEGIIRFLKLSVIIISIIPSLYLIDLGYKTVAGLTSQVGPSGYLDLFLKVRYIRISGNNYVTKDELVTYLKGVQGDNILKVHIKDIANKIKRHPWIKDVSVRRELPDTIFVDISERTPAVYLNNKGRLYIADEEGVILDNKTGSILSLPVVYGVTIRDVRLGGKSPYKQIDKQLLSALEVIRELSSLPWIDLANVGIEVEERSQVVLHLKGFRIKLGRGRYKEKLNRFYEIAKNLEDKGVSYKEVDLRFDNQVIVNTMGT